MLRLRRVARLCSSTLSDTANRLRDGRNGNPTAVPHFRSGRRSLICVRLTNKGKVGVQRGRETAGVPSFLPTAVGTASLPPSADGESPAEVQRKTLRPLGANALTQFESPAQPVQKRSRPVRANPPAAVRVPHSAGAEKEPPCQGEHADAVRAPHSAGAEKGAAPLGRTRQRQFECPAHPVQKRSRPVRANTLMRFEYPAGAVQKKFLENFQKS